ncbi:MAG: SDR family oxidoreductase [Flavobacteriaceae bacterium]
MKTISILGCGWLGRPLAVQLLSDGFRVKGSTTTEEKLNQLKQEGIHSWLIKTEAAGVVGDWNSFIENADWLLVNIPPGMKKNGSANFVASMQKLCEQIERSGIQKIILVSSTSVFQDIHQTFTEADVPNSDAENGQALYQVEQIFQNIASAKTTIIRFGGLIGNDRHPVKFLSGRTGIPAPKSVVNLIHLEDCIGIISAVIQGDFCGEVLHGVTPFHPTREAYYTQKAIELNLPAPIFDVDDLSLGKTINSRKLSTQLGYTFLKPEL